MKRLLPIFVLLSSLSCTQETAPSETQYMLQNAESYLNDTPWRRAELEASLWKPDLPYARKRLAGYALAEGGWDLLPEISPESTTIGTDITVQLVPDHRPETEEAWIALGEKVFWSMPMRRDAYLEWLLERPELLAQYGFQTNNDGSVRGVVKFEDARGNVRAGATCGLCHGDAGMAGRANRELDLGGGRAIYSEMLGTQTPFAQWGEGRIDVTDDNVVDPIAIPDLWGARYQSHLNASGAVKMSSPAAMAIRFETQFIVGHSFEARPNRILTWALAAFVLSLEPPTTEPTTVGVELFQTHCASCHVPELGYSGPLVELSETSSSPLVAQSALRGTGYYKTPTLLGVSGGGPFLHDGSAETMKALLESDHPRGLQLSQKEQQDLLSFLNTL